MFLKSITIENFRKFGKENESKNNNTIEFINASDYSKDLLASKEINIAPKTTLIIGKNNSGKTTIIRALDKLINGHSFAYNDFNYRYLSELLQEYSKIKSFDGHNIAVPEMTFRLVIGLDSYDKDSDDQDDDILTNIIPFMSLSDVQKSEVTIYIKCELQEKQLFISGLERLFKKSYNQSVLFDKFWELIADSKFKITYYNEKNESREYSIKNLIEITSVNANKITSDTCLSESFSKIVEYRYNNCKESQNEAQQKISSELDDEIVSINNKLTTYVSNNHTATFNNSLKKMLTSEKCQVLLKSDLTFKKLIASVIQYQYLEGQISIPENQFGLGYTNLMMIIAEIISYMEKYPESSFNSKINLISIEEPETYMHPQMQENFIKSINEMITSLLEDKNKHVNSQIIITTHSAHIVNSKIHQGNTFNNINYIVGNAGVSSVICLKDEDVVSLTKEQLFQVEKNNKNQKNNQTDPKLLEKFNNLSFIKKHIKFKVSELFFADYAIFVEGITEYTLLQYYIDNNDNLNKYFGSIILIDGSHAKLYENLIALLKIPTLIVTDLDIKRTESEKSEFLQIDNSNIADRITTNDSLKYFYSLKGIIKPDEDLKILTIHENGYVQQNNLMISTQLNLIQDNYATSFEEAFILTNSENTILKNVLKNLKPNVYENLISNGGLIKNSFQFQMKLAESKSEFANKLLHGMIVDDGVSETALPKLPQYIVDGLDFLIEKLKSSLMEISL